MKVHPVGTGRIWIDFHCGCDLEAGCLESGGTNRHSLRIGPELAGRSPLCRRSIFRMIVDIGSDA